MRVRGVAAARSPAFRQSVAVLLATRALVWAAAILSARALGARSKVNASLNDAPQLTAAVGGAGRVLLTPLAHWDSVWYLGIVEHGYGPLGGGARLARAAFFPLYPLLVWLASGLGHSRSVQLVAAFAVSLAGLAGAFYLLHRLVTLELGAEHAVPVLLLVALFPGALFFGIPYAESLFLLASVGAFYAARTGHWAGAGALAGAASATRSVGVFLILPLGLIYLYGPRADRSERPRSGGQLHPRYPVRANIAWLALGPLGVAAYSAYLGLGVHHGDALAWMHVQALWSRHFAGPFGGLVDGARAAWNGVHALITGSASKIYLQHGELEGERAAVSDVALFGFALAAVAATIGTFRRLPVAYGVWVVAALALPLSYPADAQPLESLPRFLCVLFPLFMWLALWCRERRALDAMALVFAGLLGLFAAQYAAWEFVA